MEATQEQKKWREVLTPHNNIFSLHLKEIWNYRDLLLLLVRRDIIAIYKQTILGPLWFLLQPILTTITFIILFSRVARLSTSDLPPVLFYLSGLVMWSYFSECITRTSTFFKDNVQVLSKVYFPRIIIPVSLALTNLVKYSIQLTLFLLVYAYFLFDKNSVVKPNLFMLLAPLLIILTGIAGLGMGMIISSLTTRYKDLMHLTTFGVQLLMFASPVIFPLSGFDNSRFKLLIMANPMSGIIEAFRFGFTGKGYFSWGLLGYDTICIGAFLFVGIIVFNSIEKSFVDSI